MLQSASEILDYGVNQIKAFPGVQAAVYDSGRVYQISAGTTGGTDGGSLVTAETLYDLASLTKPIATATAVAILMQKGRLGLEDRLSSWIADSSLTKFADCTIEQLLSHTAGLQNHIEFYSMVDHDNFGMPKAQKEVLEKLLASSMAYKPGTDELYSDLDYILLSTIIEKASGKVFARFVIDEILRPIGMENTRFSPVDNNVPVAPTGLCPVRGQIPAGQVNDTNAWIVGGASGQAGLFGNALDLMNIGIEIIDGLKGEGVLWERELLEIFSTRPFPELSGSFALGWDTVSKTGTLTGSHFSSSTVGHHGYTGTSLWIDMELDVAMALLTNRTYYHGDKSGINKVRPMFFDAVWEDLGKL